MTPLDPNFKVIAILGLCFGGAIALSGSLELGGLTALGAIVAGLLATQKKAPPRDGRLVRCPGRNCANWMEPSRRRCEACERIDKETGL